MAMSSNAQNPEVKKPIKTVIESVDNLMDKKKAEKESVISESTTAKMENTQGEVAEVMGGMEKPSEKIAEKTEKKGENKGSGTTSGTIGDDDTKVGGFSVKQYIFPSDEVMIRKIRTAINAQIKVELKKAQQYQGQLGTGGAAKYNIAIAKIRALKHILSFLFSSAADF